MVQQSDYSIALNFFPLAQQDFKFTVYRRLCNEQVGEENDPDCKERRLPANTQTASLKSEAESYQRFWVCYKQREGFEPFNCTSLTNYHITLDYLYFLLKKNCAPLNPSEYIVDEHGFLSRILIIIGEHPNDRREAVWLQTYFLKSKGLFGFLADYKLIMPSATKLTKRDLELSLTHKNGQLNRDHYVDRFNKLQRFVSLYHNKLFPLSSDFSQIHVSKKLQNVQAELLRTKTYIFADKNTSRSQFVGVKDYGPLSIADEGVKIYFLYRPQDKPLSYDLYRALRGDTFKTFPGMEQMFKFKMDQESIGGIPADSFEKEDLERACATIAADAKDRKVVPVLITPFIKGDSPEGNRAYHIAKHTMLKRGWPSQFVSVDTLRNTNTLKWSVSNIGLQLFAKLGGQPWIVKPESQKCLIIGLSQAHHVENGVITRYYAYTVLTDSSGLYEDARVLSSSNSEKEYLNGFKTNLKKVFDEFGERYNDFVVHATFSVRKRELTAINEVLNSMLESMDATKPSKRFVVMKFNDYNRFFGYYNDSNSLIPYESSILPLSDTDYLVWFEGLQRHNPNIYKRIERPLLVTFLYPQEGLEKKEKIRYLQDAVNLSGANWRGFNAKSFPVSVYYAKLIADYFQEFQSLNLGEIDLHDINPWFL